MTDFRTPVTLGTTGLEVGRLGIGSSFGASTKVIEDAAERGANYLYWGSFRRPAFGRAMGNLAKRNRDSVVLTVQSYSRVPALLGPSIETSLRRVASSTSTSCCWANGTSARATDFWRQPFG